MAPSAFPDAMYAADEKVLCFHRQFLYEAKVLDLKLDKDDPEPNNRLKYKVHYKGWKNTWDDWVPQDRMRKFTEENRELAKSLHDTEKARQTAARRSTIASLPPPSSTTTTSGPSTGTKRTADAARLSLDARGVRGTKRAREGKEPEGIEREEDFFKRPAIRIQIPDRLKSLLVDDWENVTKQNNVPVVPSETPVTKFLDDYSDAELPKRREGSADADILVEVIAGVKEYFNRCLGRLLLYRRERPQWVEIHSRINKSTGDLSGKSIAEVYGVEHLLRLFAALPDLIAHTNMDTQAVTRLKEEIFKMLQFLLKNVGDYLNCSYVPAGPPEELESS